VVSTGTNSLLNSANYCAERAYLTNQTKVHREQP